VASRQIPVLQFAIKRKKVCGWLIGTVQGLAAPGTLVKLPFGVGADCSDQFGFVEEAKAETRIARICFN
jgi:hypothetical protein